MIKNIKLALSISIALIGFLGCKKPYNPPQSSKNTNYLVVEGAINDNGGTTTIKLSRTIKLNANGFKPETNATVTVINSAGSLSIQLSELSPGVYSNSSTNLLGSATVSLKIATSDGKIYQSDVVPVKDSPPIDTVGYNITSAGLQIYSGTHDPTNNTRYYRWDYQETWIIHSGYASLVEATTTPPESIIPRMTQDEINICWASDTSSTIVVNSSSKLAQDVIQNNPITSIDMSSEKLLHEYSILVNQYALTATAFNYYQNIKKNTEQLGSIFDAQPSEIQGNIRSVSDPAEPVIGYVTAGASSQKRIFVGELELPNTWYFKAVAALPAAYFQCPIDTVGVPIIAPNYTGPVFGSSNTPIAAVGFPFVTGYAVSLNECVDCRIRGTNVQPSFWINKF